MDKNQRLLAMALIAVAVILAGSALYILSSKNVYEYSFEGVVIASDSSNPVEALESFSKKDSFIVSPEFRESGNINEYMGNAMQLFIVVLSGNDKNAIQLIRVVDGEGNLIECGTNFGDVLQSKVLDAEECNSLIDFFKKDSVFFDIRLPNPQFGKPRALVEESTVTIQVSSYEYVGNTAFSVIKLVFPDAETILSRTNESISSLSDST